MTVPVRFFEERRHAFAWDLLAQARGIETWRRTLALVLRDWGASGPAVELACLGVSELLANVVRHVDDPRCRLAVVLDGELVGVLVHDRSTRLPVVVEPAWDAESGRGLWMLRAMAEEFGCETVHQGKAVWFGLHLNCGEAAA
ncbi:ATP-binding protein [Streptomyces sp. NPDC049881]|uniref:ATP-binding protein n=1 Tax=unclassified Streptomyces TaxID=2593676 RepID=UPI00343C8002